MTLFSLLLYALLIVLLINAYLIYNEKFQYRTAWPYPPSHEAMTSIAAAKKDHEMDDAEFDLKYGAFRHEMFRFSLFSKALLNRLNILLHYVEMYALYGGPSALRHKFPIAKPIFIIGDFRSGTSVLERLIAHHP